MAIPLRHMADILQRGGTFLKNILEASEQRTFVLGLSGGLDSSTVAMWACNLPVMLINMPYGWAVNGQTRSADTRASVYDALLVGSELDREVIISDITKEVDAAYKALVSLTPIGVPISKLAFGNIHARVRANRLRAICNVRDGLLLGTENRTEHLLGYFTIGGDEQSDVEILLPFHKSEVVQIASHVGVPQSIIRKPPSAGLWEGQTDEDEFGFTYEEAEIALPNILAHLEGFAIPSLSAMGIEQSVYERVEAQFKRTEFKRAPKAVFERKIC